jgi:hypothetical protein
VRVAPGSGRAIHIRIATITPAQQVHQCWQAGPIASGDYTREASEHIGFTGFEDSPYEDVIACSEGGVPVNVTRLAPRTCSRA